MNIDFITILKAQRGRTLAKRINLDRTFVDYDLAKYFTMAMVSVCDLDHLAAHLRHLAPRQDLALIRGQIIGTDRTKRARRLLLGDLETGDKPTLEAAPHRWIGLDMDGVTRPSNVPASDLPRCAELAIRLLPGEFRGAACIVQATAGHGIKPGARLRLWFWADRPVSDKELARWFRRSPVDSHLFNPIQLHFTADPIFPPGMPDHLPTRLAFLPGTECVGTPSPAMLAPTEPTCVPTRPITSPDQRLTRIMTTALVKVETAAEGELHDRLRAAAYTFGGIMDFAGIGEREATEKLIEACKRAAGPRANPTKDAATIKSGIASGRTKPMALRAASHG